CQRVSRPGRERLYSRASLRVQDLLSGMPRYSKLVCQEVHSLEQRLGHGGYFPTQLWWLAKCDHLRPSRQCVRRRDVLRVAEQNCQGGAPKFGWRGELEQCGYLSNGPSAQPERQRGYNRCERQRLRSWLGMEERGRRKRYARAGEQRRRQYLEDCQRHHQ